MKKCLSVFLSLFSIAALAVDPISPRTTNGVVYGITAYGQRNLKAMTNGAVGNPGTNFFVDPVSGELRAVRSANGELAIDSPTVTINGDATVVGGFIADGGAFEVSGSGNVSATTYSGGGSGLVGVPLDGLAQSGATANQVPQWNGSTWVPATVSGGGGWTGNPNQFDANGSYTNIKSGALLTNTITRTSTDNPSAQTFLQSEAGSVALQIDNDTAPGLILTGGDFRTASGKLYASGAQLSGLTASRVTVTDGSKNIASVADSSGAPINSAGTVATTFTGNGSGLTNITLNANTNNLYALMVTASAGFFTNIYGYGIVGLPVTNVTLAVDATRGEQTFSIGADFTLAGFTGLLGAGYIQYPTLHIVNTNVGSSIVATLPANLTIATYSTNRIYAGQSADWDFKLESTVRSNVTTVLFPNP